MHFHIVTLFPEAFSSYFDASIIGRAIKDKKIKISFYNPRDFAKNKWHRIDQKPYGGGPGMVLEAEPFLRAARKAIGTKKDVEVIIFDASGKEFTNTQAATLAKKKKHIVLLCGRYEGIDARVQKILKAKRVSVGPYTLTGGELPAMAVVDAISRQVEGVLGTFESVEEKRVSTAEVYTKPEVFKWKGKEYKVPKILLSGNHAEIEKWKAGGKSPNS